MTERDVTAPDGRVLRVSEDGDPAGVPVLRHAGTPNARDLSGVEVAKARDHGIRLISYDRPGYGGSSRHPGRNVADCAADVRTIADALGIRRLGVWGVSGGGPHAAACAALLGGLVPAVGVVASPAPWGAPGLDWLTGMGDDNIAEFGAVRDGPEAAGRYLTAARAELTGLEPDTLREALATLLSPADAAVLSGELAHDLWTSFQTALAPGIDGWLDDDLAFLSDWGFGLSQIRTPVLLMHGVEDRFVPIAHGRWLAETIPGVEARLLDDDGHLTLLVNRLDEVYGWLLERMR